MEQQIFDLLFNKDEITWQGIIYDLVKSEQMDPWDINVSELSRKFLQRLRKMKEMDLRISGKVILASAILLKMKSTKLMEDDINGLDSLIASMQSTEEDYFEELLDYNGGNSEVLLNKPTIYPRTPQPRKRKVSVFDLVNALEKALDVQARRKPIVSDAPEVTVPEKPRDISLVIKDVYNQITAFFTKNAKKAVKLTFDLLLPSKERIDIVYTFIPLLHLDNQRKINLVQKKHFGEIEIKMLKGKVAH
ncbi:segregation/condensation protein A [Candidatus Woesearchaeota archaeon]|nr:segregation/condensation protein A [Candidatus Woesearchaeota archaeon]